MLIASISLLSLYASGTLLNLGYRLMRISELKVDYDTTRSKDVKNECLSLARHHMNGLRSSWRWPATIVVGVTDALKWGRSSESK